MKKHHYLISLVCPGIADVHCYLMSTNPGHVEGAMARTVKETEDRLLGGRPHPLPMLLVTELDPAGVKEVRAVLRKQLPADGSLATAREFHISVWAMAPENAASRQLMAMH